MRRSLFFIILLLFSRCRLEAEMITDFLVIPDENSITLPDTTSSSDAAFYSFEDANPIVTNLQIDLLSMSFDRGRLLESDPKAPGFDRLSRIPEAVRSIPETSTCVLVVTGLFGAFAVSLKNRFRETYTYKARPYIGKDAVCTLTESIRPGVCFP